MIFTVIYQFNFEVGTWTNSVFKIFLCTVKLILFILFKFEFSYAHATQLTVKHVDNQLRKSDMQ